jgi:hypothetical protein
MSKPFYSDYVRHAMRFYSRTKDTIPYGKSDADQQNWIACSKVIKEYSHRDKDILVSVYGGYDTLPDNVYEMANKYHINQNIIWDLMKEFEYRVAKMRGLV